MPNEKRPVAISNTSINLGLVIHASKLLDFGPLLQKVIEDYAAKNLA